MRIKKRTCPFEQVRWSTGTLITKTAYRALAGMYAM